MSLRSIIHSIGAFIGRLLILPIRFYQKYISPHTPPPWPFTTHLQPVCDRGDPDAWSDQGSAPGYLASAAVQSLGW